MQYLPDSPEVQKGVSNLVGAFVANLKHEKLREHRNNGESLSAAAAVEMAELMANIVRLFQYHEEQPNSITVQMLKANYPALEVVTLQVRRLLLLIARAGDALLRSQFATLLLMNVTRRVLSLLREAAANNKATEGELELEAKHKLDGLGSDEEAREEDAVLAAAKEIAKDEHHREEGGRGHQDNLIRSAEKTPQAGEHKRNIAVRPHLGAASFNDFNSPLINRSGSFVASEIPGQQLLPRAPSNRQELPHSSDQAEFPVKMGAFFEDAINGIEELKNEMENMGDELCRRASKQLHSSDTVITMGFSNTIYRYLVEAANAGRNYKIIILEGAPARMDSVEALGVALRKCGLNVQILPDSSAFAVMSTCTKVLVGAESVLANGGMLAPIGTHMLCIAAKHFAVPVIVATTTLKMSPYYPSDQLCTRLVRITRSGAQEMPWSTYGTPEDVLPFPYGIPLEDAGKSFVVHSPVTEYVPPELIALYATNETEFTPSQVHRFVRANYSDAD